MSTIGTSQTTLKPSTVIEDLEICFKLKQQLLIVGPPAIGKTDCVKQAAQRAGMQCIISHPSIDDPTDAKGFPFPAQDGNSAKFLPYGKLKKILDSGEPTVWLLDDLGQASESVQKSYMQPLRGRLMGDHYVPDHVVFCAATNDVKQMSGVMGLLEPIKSRFHSIIFMEADLNDWCKWAEENDMPAVLIAFLRTNPKLLSNFKPTRDFTNCPSPREWEAVGKRWNEKVYRQHLDEGSVGKGAAIEAYAFLELAQKAPSIDAMLMDPKNSEVPEEPSIRYLVAGGIARRMTKSNMKAALEYLYRMPQPFRVMSLLDATRRDKALTKTAAFCSWASKEGADLI